MLWTNREGDLETALPEHQSSPHPFPLPSSCFSLAGVLHIRDNTFLKWSGIRQDRSDCNPGYPEDEAAGSRLLMSSRSVWALWWDPISKQKQLWLEILEESNDKSLSYIIRERNTPTTSLTSPFFLSQFTPSRQHCLHVLTVAYSCAIQLSTANHS